MIKSASIPLDFASLVFRRRSLGWRIMYKVFASCRLPQNRTRSPWLAVFLFFLGKVLSGQLTTGVGRCWARPFAVVAHRTARKLLVPSWGFGSSLFPSLSILCVVVCFGGRDAIFILADGVFEQSIFGDCWWRSVLQFPWSYEAWEIFFIRKSWTCWWSLIYFQESLLQYGPLIRNICHGRDWLSSRLMESPRYESTTSGTPGSQG